MGPGGDLDVSAGGVVAERVVDEVGDQALEQSWISRGWRRVQGCTNVEIDTVHIQYESTLYHTTCPPRLFQHFHSEEMGDYFITRLQQQHETVASELDNYKAHMCAQSSLFGLLFTD